tara:strand:+ start:5521 stop:8715 length:3195 start_codon:yes stop_codon:yes gene_type:complete
MDTPNDSNDTPIDPPSEIDDALAHAFQDDPDSPSVLDRIQDQVGSRPKVSLKDADEGPAPMLNPLGENDALESGKYVVHGELGAGGVGAVHRGHDQDLGRDVAVKFLHDKYKDDPQIVHRFVEEAQIGGQLQHPGIVPVYDLGMTDGKPFFTMKLVKGETLAKKLSDRTDIADDRRVFLSIFEDVCQTMAYAHARGVVHRDLKPANIMIGSFGEVQVVDWGMGKVLKQGGVADEARSAEKHADLSVIETVRSGGHGTQSIVGSVMGTPAYMPPEQARGDVEAMDERSDVFALGAILCEILTGVPPYTGTIHEQISSAAMGKLDDALARLESCGGEPDMIELATSCLIQAPAARPRSAEIVAKAVHDHLAAVEARVHEARVEAAEAQVKADALRRTQRLSLALIGVFAIGLAFSLFFWKQADDATHEERIAKGRALDAEQVARDKEALAVEEGRRAVEIKTLLVEMLGSVSPKVALGADTTLLRGILDDTAGRLERGEVEDGLVAAELHNLIGTIRMNLAQDDVAVGHYESAVAIHARELGVDHIRTLEARSHLAAALSGCFRFQEAEEEGRSVVESLRRVLGIDHVSTIGAVSNLGKVLATQSRFGEAEGYFREALEAADRSLGLHSFTISIRTNLALALMNQGRVDEGQPLLDQAFADSTEFHGPEHPVTLGIRKSQVDVLQISGHLDLAAVILKDLIEIHGRIHGSRHSKTLDVRISHASLDSFLGRTDQAIADLEAVLEILEEDGDPLGKLTLETRRNLASAFMSNGDLDRAASLLEETLEETRSIFGSESTEAFRTLSMLADVETSRGNHELAIEMYKEALAGIQSSHGPDSSLTSDVKGDLARAYGRNGDLELAKNLYQDVLKADIAWGGKDSLPMSVTRGLLGAIELALGEVDASIASMERSMEVLIPELGYEHATTSYILGQLAAAYDQAGDSAATLELMRGLVESWIDEAEDPGTGAFRVNQIARWLLTVDVVELRDPERSISLAQRSIEIAENAEETDIYLFGYHDTHAMALFRSGSFDEAVKAQRLAIEMAPDGIDTSDLESRLDEYVAATEKD